MTEDEEFADEYDAEQDLVASFFPEEEIIAGSGKISKFATLHVDTAAMRLDLSKILPEFAKWDETDREYRGGRKPVLDDRAIMIACLMLRSEGSPLHITQIANVFRFRLTKGAKARFGIPGEYWTMNIKKDIRNWYNRAARSLHRILARMDAWPARRGRHTRLQRIELTKNRSTLAAQNLHRLKLERISWFTNSMLHMTFKAQPPRLQRRWKGGLSVDQTAVKTFSQAGPRKRDKDGNEIPKFDKEGVEIERWTSEVDAGYYPSKPAPSSSRGGAPGISALTSQILSDVSTRAPKAPPLDVAYMANITVMTKAVTDNVQPASHPILVMGLSMAQPNKDIPGQTVRAVEAIAARGHDIHHLTFDRGYRGAETLLKPLHALGVPVVMEFNDPQLGIKGGSGGAVHVEGQHYCPATPETLLEASRKYREKSIDWETWQNHLKERIAYEAHKVEKPDEKDRVPISCPALGPNATVDCPIRAKHPGRPTKWKSRPKIMKANIPKALPKICTAKKSVSINLLDTIEHQQLLRYGSPEWESLYTRDRNLMESWNSILTNSGERLSHAADRRIRGLAAHQFIVTMMAVSANLSRIAAFLQEERFETPKKSYPRGRDIRGESAYVNAKRKPRAGRVKPDTPART